MRDELLDLVKQENDPNKKLNIMREYLQAFTLRSLNDSEAFNHIAFVGGTALRFLYQLPRFSEDLDFSLDKKEGYDLEKWLLKLKRELEFAKFEPELILNTDKVVHSCWIKFAGLLYDAGMAPMKTQKISIKLEVDTNPPKGACLEKKVINKYFLFAIQHYDLPSLMAGKVHALCMRKYVKGRDYYDFIWYRTQQPPIEPNLKQLDAALRQTLDEPFPAKDWPEYLKNKMIDLDWQKVREDVAVFLERPKEIELLNKENLLGLLPKT
jgi:hypothetical protein